jgi:predicted nucleotidyltransferase
MSLLGTEKNILQTLAYFDMFHYPLTAEEIYLFLGRPLTLPETQTLLNELAAKACIYKTDEFYSLRSDNALAARRRKGNQEAQRLLAMAYRIGRLLGKFPFVKGVGISGSLSKNYADEDSDIDFFIITSANRLWIARTLLHLLKKISFLIGRQHWFCMNYFVDETMLLMQEKNIFIAAELVTVQPVTGGAMSDLFTANLWASEYFPNHPFYLSGSQRCEKACWVQAFFEFLFNNRVGECLDQCLMRITQNRWLRKEKMQKTNNRGEIMALRVNRHFAKPDPAHFQQKILTLYQKKLNDIQSPPADGPLIFSAVR